MPLATRSIVVFPALHHPHPPASTQGEERRARRLTSCLAVALPLVAAGCASAPAAPAPPKTGAQIASQWQVPLPHGGQLAGLQQWWSQFDDPLLPRLIDAAQRASPTVARAEANIADARAARVASSAALLPSLGINVAATRGRPELASPLGTVLSAGVSAGWELDPFGAQRAGVGAAEARLASSEAGWHDARVAVAAEVGRHYVELRACEAFVQHIGLDASSRLQTAHLTDLAVQAGLRSPASADLARASAAQGETAWVGQRAHCDLVVKALVALTAQDEPTLRRGLARGAGRLPRPIAFSVATVPAEMLAQRPDVHAAGQDVVAASALSAQAMAQRWPRITLAGQIGAAHVDSVGVSTDGTAWSMGPVVITLPLFDGGMRRASAQAAQVRYEVATTVYAARLREAIREVEGALLALQSTAQRAESAREAADGFERAYAAMADSYRAGAASLFELEDARRSRVSAQSVLTGLQHERLLAWIALYRSIGGGWSPTAPTPTPAPTPAPAHGEHPLESSPAVITDAFAAVPGEGR